MVSRFGSAQRGFASAFHGLVAMGALAVATWVAAPTAQATTVRAVSDAELVQYSEAIAFGVVLDAEPYVSSGGVVLTRAHIQVYEPVLGVAAGEVVPVDLLGGRLPGGVTVSVPGAPSVQVGQWVFGFLAGKGHVKKPLGQSYGFLRGHRGDDGSFTVSRDGLGLQVLDHSGKKAAPGVYRIDAMPLTDFIARLRPHVLAKQAEQQGTPR